MTDLFFNAGIAMMTFLYPKNIEIPGYEVKEKINIRSRSKELLLADWLSLLLYFSEQKKVCYNNFYFEKITETELDAVAYGRRSNLKESIKSLASRHLIISKTGDGFETFVSFDI